MKNPHRALSVVAGVALLAACKSGYDPGGTYAGTLTETAQVMAGPAGAATANVSNTTRPNAHASITVERIHPSQVRVTFSPTCVVLYDLGAAPNEQNATVSANPQQTCTVDVPGYRGTVAVTGTALFARGNSAVTQLTATGPITAVGAAGTWSVTFDGTSPTH